MENVSIDGYKNEITDSIPIDDFSRKTVQQNGDQIRRVRKTLDDLGFNPDHHAVNTNMSSLEDSLSAAYGTPRKVHGELNYWRRQ